MLMTKTRKLRMALKTERGVEDEGVVVFDLIVVVDLGGRRSTEKL